MKMFQWGKGARNGRSSGITYCKALADLKVKEIVCGSKATMALSLDGVVYSLELNTEGDYTSAVCVCVCVCTCVRVCAACMHVCVCVGVSHYSCSLSIFVSSLRMCMFLYKL